MLDLDSRVARVSTRARARRRTIEKRSIAVLSSSCAVLLACLAGVGAILADPVSGDVVGLYGASLLFNGVGGYVLVGLICFAAAVVITLCCISYRRKSEHRMSDVDIEKGLEMTKTITPDVIAKAKRLG